MWIDVDIVIGLISQKNNLNLYIFTSLIMSLINWELLLNQTFLISGKLKMVRIV